MVSGKDTPFPFCPNKNQTVRYGVYPGDNMQKGKKQDSPSPDPQRLDPLGMRNMLLDRQRRYQDRVLIL